jgi:hypothetical protein
LAIGRWYFLGETARSQNNAANIAWRSLIHNYETKPRGENRCLRKIQKAERRAQRKREKSVEAQATANVIHQTRD